MKSNGKSRVRKMQNKEKSNGVSYRLKCAKSANGLSHFIMYGDVPKAKAVL